MKPSSPGAKPFLFYCNVLFVLSLLTGILFILHLPLFPSGDGPVHLYYAHILWSLVMHRPQYQPFYAVRHLVGIYSIHYFALIFFEHFLSPAKAEELFVSIILANTAFGFRFLAGRLGKNAAVASLWMIPLLLTWPLGGGFFNYCFATGTLYWALGFWMLLPPAGSALALGGLMAALIMLVFSHPVPLLFLAVFMAVDLGILWIEGRRFPGGRRFNQYRLRFLVLCLTCLAMIVPSLLIEKGGMVSALRDLYPHPYLLAEVLSGGYLGLFGGPHFLPMLHTLLLLEIVPIVVLLMERQVRGHIQGGATTAADRLLIFSVAFLVATLCFPRVLNGAHYFPERFWSLLWPLVLACAAGAAVQERAVRWLSVAGTVFILISGVVAFSTLLPAARMQAELAQLRVPAGSRGVFLEPVSVMNRYTLGFTYSVFYWSGVRALDRSRAILLNSPWFDQAQVPIVEREGSGMLVDSISEYDLDHAFAFTESISAPSHVRDITLQASDFFLYSDPVGGNAYLTDSVYSILRDQQEQWSCSYGSFYALCRKRSAMGREIQEEK